MQSKRQRLETLRAQMELERSSFIPHWRDLSDYIMPRRARFFLNDTNRGERRNQKIIDSTATLAARTLRSGMMAGITSPARPWFKLSTPDQDLSEFGAVKEWLDIATTRMSSVFIKSNLYQRLPVLYGDLGTFGSPFMFIERDNDALFRVSNAPIGSYSLATNNKGAVDTIFREFRMTVAQVVSEFGKKDRNGSVDWSNISDRVKTCYDNGDYITWIDICHVVKPNDDADPRYKDHRSKPFISCYYEKGTGYMHNDNDTFLREEGHDFFPGFAPRWEVTGEDVYATDCPGMTCLGDVKALQLMHKRKSQAIEKIVNPPMIAPTRMADQKTSILPGDITYLDEMNGASFRPAHEINFRLGELTEDIREHQFRIKRAYFEDLFLMFTESDRREITAREIEARGEEKLLAIGPVLEQLNQELLDPLIDITFDFMMKAQMLPPPPQELQGVDLRVEYVSVMAQAQKLVSLGGVERFAQFAGNMAAIDPRILDKVNTDELINIYGDLTSVPQKLIVPDEEAQGMRAQRAKQMEQQAKAEQMSQVAGTAKQLSETSTEDDSALKMLLGGGM